MKRLSDGNFRPESFKDFQIGQLVIQNFTNRTKWKNRYILWKIIGLNQKTKRIIFEIVLDSFKMLAKFTKKNFKFTKKKWKIEHLEILG